MPGKKNEQGKRTNPIQLQKYLKGLDYPAEKKDILAKARAEGADETARSALEQLPDRTYQTPADISKEVGKVE